MGTSANQRPNSGLTITRRNPAEPRTLSFVQERLWYMDQLAPGNSVYNTPLKLRLSGKLNIKALKHALDSVVQRHEPLRTAFLASGGRPVPVVLKKRPVDLKEIDLRKFSVQERDKESERLLAEEACKPFNLARDPMSRAILIQLDQGEFILLYSVHHIVFEGSSVAILFRDLAEFYNAFVEARSPRLPDLPIDYSDFAAWQRRALTPERLEVLNAFWRRRLTGAPLVDLPLDFPRPAVHTMRGAKYFFTFPSDLLESTSAFFRQTATTSYRGLCAAFNVLLHCYTGLTDISLGTPCTPRCRGIEDLIGFFVNTVVLRVQFADDPSFLKLIRKVDAALHGAIAHGDLPFHKIVEAVQPPRDTSRTPLFQINFRAPQQLYPLLELNGIKASRVEVLDNGTAKFDLALEVGGFVSGASYFEYCTDLFAEKTILQMTDDFQQLLRALVATQELPISQIEAVREITRRVRSHAGVLR